MRKLIFFALICLVSTTLQAKENSYKQSIETFCLNEAKPESQSLCKSYLRMMIISSHHVGYASAACDAKAKLDVNCSEVKKSESEINKLQSSK
ncbi:hypothetical protein PO369_13130 [Phytobacter diazotrophicus]|uniref:hypothetical protein n=1 Tax=Phytobacter diazotrophicus TaxID=395631 RepID=UPI002FF68B91